MILPLTTHDHSLKQWLIFGANIIVAGSAIFSGDVTENTIRFLNIINE